MKSISILLVAFLLNCGLTSISFGGSDKKRPLGTDIIEPGSKTSHLQDEANQGSKHQTWTFGRLLWKYRWYLGTGTAILVIFGIGYQSGGFLNSMGENLRDFLDSYASGNQKHRQEGQERDISPIMQELQLLRCALTEIKNREQAWIESLQSLQTGIERLKSELIGTIVSFATNIHRDPPSAAHKHPPTSQTNILGNLRRGPFVGGGGKG